MDEFAAAVVSAYNRTLREQEKLEDGAIFSFIQFASEVSEPAPAGVLDHEEYKPVGRTRLWDGICRAILHGERGKRVVVVVVTDGEDTDSVVQHSDCAKRVRRTIEDGWVWLFLGANQDAIKVGRSLGIPAEQCLTFAAKAAGVGKAFGALSVNLLNWRCGGLIGWTDQQRQEQRLLLNERNP